MADRNNFKILHSKDEAIRRLQAAYTGIVRRIIMIYLDDERLIEECMNDVWYNLSEHLEKVDDLGSRMTRQYVCKTARNAAIDVYRRENREIPVGAGTDVREIVHDGNVFPFRNGENNKDVNREVDIDELISLLKPMDREIIVLHRCYKFTYKEIGKAIGISTDAARKRGERAEKMLKEKGKGKGNPK